MQRMFFKCRELKEIKGINNFNTSNVYNMKGMFEECNELKYLNLSNFITINVLNMNKMFAECFELEILDLSNFDTSNTTDMGYMFYKCYKLKEIKKENIFNIAKVVNIEGIFEDCSELKNLKALIPQLEEEKQEKKSGLNIEKKKLNITFDTMDQFIHHSMSCYNTDLFSDIEDELYSIYPQLKHKDNFFLCGGDTVKRSITLQENKIKDGDHIIIYDND